MFEYDDKFISEDDYWEEYGQYEPMEPEDEPSYIRYTENRWGEEWRAHRNDPYNKF